MKFYLIVIGLSAPMFIIAYLAKDSAPPVPSLEDKPVPFTYWHSIDHVPSNHTRSIALVEPGIFYYWHTSHIPNSIGSNELKYNIRGNYHESATHLKLQSDFGTLTFEKFENNNGQTLLKRSDLPELTHSLPAEGWVLEQVHFKQTSGHKHSGLPKKWNNRPLAPSPPSEKTETNN